MKLARSFRRDAILEAGLEFVRKYGYHAITCQNVGEVADCSYNTVRRHFPNRVQLAMAIRDYAKLRGEMELYKQGKRATAGV